MISQSLLVTLALVEAGLVVATMAVLVGHAAGRGLRARLVRRRLEHARRVLVDDGLPASACADALLPLPPRMQVELMAELAPSLRGERRRRLALGAAEAGLTAQAERWSKSPQWWRRLRGARLFTVIGAGELLVPQLFDDPSAEVRVQAAEWAVEHPTPEILDRLTAMLDDPETLCRFTVKDSLLRLGSAAMDPLLRHIERTNGRPGDEALEVAAGIADPRFLGAALRLCADRAPRTRTLAARLIGAIGGSDAVAMLERLLDDPAPEVRAVAAAALGRLGHWPAAATLGGLLRDDAWDVRQAAGLALRRLGAPGRLMLQRALTDEDRFARDMARQITDLPAPGAA